MSTDVVYLLLICQPALSMDIGQRKILVQIKSIDKNYKLEEL